jgi:hypothetical protein
MIEMIPMEPNHEDFERMLSERRASMDQSRVIAHYAHSRTGLLTRYLRTIAERVDPTGRQRRELR